MPAALKRIRFDDMELFTGQQNTVAMHIVNMVSERRCPATIIGHVNLYNYYLIKHDESEFKAFAKDWILLIDGVGMQLCCQFMGIRWLPDLNGTDLYPHVMQATAKRGLRVFFFGATQPILDAAVTECRHNYAGINIVGTQSGYFPRSQESEIIARVRASGADLVLMSRGSGLQSKFLARHLDDLGATVVWNTGGLFDFLSGAKPRAPVLWRRLRLEWFYRMLLEPRRMAYRNFIAAPWVIWHCAKLAIRRYIFHSIPGDG